VPRNTISMRNISATKNGRPPIVQLGDGNFLIRG